MSDLHWATIDYLILAGLFFAVFFLFGAVGVIVWMIWEAV